MDLPQKEQHGHPFLAFNPSVDVLTFPGLAIALRFFADFFAGSALL